MRAVTGVAARTTFRGGSRLFAALRGVTSEAAADLDFNGA